MKIYPLLIVALVAATTTSARGQSCLDRLDPVYASPPGSLAMGTDHLVVGYPVADLAAADEGAAVIYRLDPVTGTFEEDARLEPGLGAGAEFGRDVDVEGDVAVALALGADVALVYERTASGWAQALSIPGAPSHPGLRAVGTNGQDVIVSDQVGTRVFRKAGGTWQLFASPTGVAGWGPSLAISPNHLAVRGKIYSTSAYVEEGDYSLYAFGGAGSLAFDASDVLHGYEQTFFGWTHQSFARSAQGTWASTAGPGALDAAEMSQGPNPRLAATDRGLFVSGAQFNAPFSGTQFITGVHWYRRASLAAPLDLPSFVRSFEGLLGAKLAASGPRLAVLVAGGTVEVHDVDCDPVSTLECAQTAANSSGEQATLIAGGSRDVSLNDLTLTAGHLPAGSFGFFIASRSPGFSANPGGSQGDLCLAGDIGRYVGPGQIQNSGASRSIALALDLTAVPGPTGSVSVTAGETWVFQGWYRDANPTITSNFTDAVSVQFQ